MPIGINSPARNLFLLGSSGAQVVSNFFKLIDQSSTTNDYYQPSGIIFNESDEQYLLSGTAKDTNLSPNKDFGWFEKRDDAGTVDWDIRVEATSSGVDTSLRAMEMDSNDNLIVVGKTGDIPWIAKYSNGGVIDWQSTTNSADVEYTGVTSDSNGQYYACGNTPNIFAGTTAQAFVEKFDSNGNPGWGKSAFMLGRDVVLSKVAANDRGHVVAVGYLEDDTANKGYIIKIDTNTGEVLWDRTLSFTDKADGDSKNLKINDIKIDEKDQIYVVGEVGINSFVVKYTAEGNILWQKQTAFDFDNTINYIAHKSLTVNSVIESVTVASDYSTGIGQPLHTVLSNYNKKGDLVWRRQISQGINDVRDAVLDSEGAFVYFIYAPGNALIDKYTFGKLSATGNGLGDFQYDDGGGVTIDYEYIDTGDLANDNIGRLSDGSVRQDTSDLITYPFNANKLLFDDLATQVSNKKRQMDSADSFEYSGSPAIRPADFQELNLLGDNVSDRTWTDTSGKGNNGVASLTEPFFGAGSTTFGVGQQDCVVASSSSDFNYGSNDFTIEAFLYFTSNQTAPSGGQRIFLQGVAGNTQVGLNYNFGNTTFEFDIQSVTRFTVSYSISLRTWYHIAIVRTSGSTYEFFVNGVSQGTNSYTFSQSANQFIIGGLNWANGYGTIGSISNVRVSNIARYTTNFISPSSPLIADSNTVLLTCQGDSIVDASPNTKTVTANGNAAPTDDGPTHNAAGYWEFDGTDKKIIVNDENLRTIGFGSHAIEAWVYPNSKVEEDFVATGSGVGAVLLMIYIQAGGGNGGFRGHSWSTTDSNVIDSPNEITLNQWHHLVQVVDYDAGYIKLYENGVETASQSLVGSAPTSHYDPLQRFVIGSRYSNTSTNSNIDGNIGEVRIYPRALTAAQVFQNYNATKSKYINEAPDTAPKIGSGIVYDSNLLLNYDFGNRATYDSTSNEFTFSDDLTNSNWVVLASTIVQEYNDKPKGFETNSTAIIRSTTAEAQLVRQTFTTPSGVPVNISCYAKSIAGGNLCINYNSGTVLFDFSTETGTAIAQYDYNGTDTSPIPSSITMESVGDGWYRCSFTGYTNGVVAQCQFQPWTQAMSVIDATTWDDRYDAGDGEQGVAIIGTQFAEGVTTPPRYFKTSGTAITAPTTVKNLSSNSINLPVRNGAIFNSGGWFDFDGTNQDIWDGSPQTIVYSGGTFEAWLYFDDVSSNRGFMSHSAGGTGPYINFYMPGASQSKMRWEVIGITTQPYQTILSNTVLTTGQWYHFVGTFNGTDTITLYVNGTQDAQDTNMTNQPTTNNSAIRLAEYAGFMDGRIGEARIYNRGLTATEVSQNFNATRSKYGV